MRFALPAFLLVACHAPTKDGPALTDDTGGACDPTVASLDVPDFHAAPLPLTVHVSPAEIDPASDQQPEDDHVVMVLEDGPTLAPLFVMLPGTDGHPANNLHLLTIAAQSGYRAIGLAYRRT
jgi:hypothetical protein